MLIMGLQFNYDYIGLDLTIKFIIQIINKWIRKLSVKCKVRIKCMIVKDGKN